MSKAKQGPENSNAIIILILGVMGVCGGCTAPIALIMGNSYMKQCIYEDVEPEQTATIGRILGIIGTLFILLWCFLGCAGGVLQVVLAS